LRSRQLPRGYGLAILPADANVHVHPNPPAPANQPAPVNETIPISDSQNIAKVAISLLQVVYTGFTLYRARGDQIDRFGYAAFGLTVLPYLIMSATNLLAAILTPDYSMLYLVRTPELNEAGITVFDGSVGCICPQNPAQTNTTFRPSRNGRAVRVEADGQTRTFHNQRMLTKLWVPAFSEYRRIGSIGWKNSHVLGFSLFLCFDIGSIPFAVIAWLTDFQPRQSTITERVFTMLWLTVDILFGSFFFVYKRNVYGNAQFAINIESSNAWVTANRRELPAKTWGLSGWFIIRHFIFLVPAIGGYVMVVSMIMKFGVCKLF
jgi:hypothetical protein